MMNRIKERRIKKRGRRLNLPLINIHYGISPQDRMMEQYEDDARNFKIRQENRELNIVVV